MAHGITITMRAIKRPELSYVHQHEVVHPGPFQYVRGTTYTNPNKDRSLSGKARRVARKAARR